MIAVSIKKWDNCYTYALKRTDNTHLLKTESNDVLDTYKLESFQMNELSPGDIIVSHHQPDIVTYANTITSSGQIISSELEFFGYHFMVVEENGYVSEVVRNNGIPQIVMKELNDSVQDKFMKLKLEKCK